MFAGANFVVATLIPLVWALGAFRPQEISPEITRAINDLGFFLFTFAWTPGGAWFAILAITIFSDKAAQPLYPRWLGYFSLWCALLEVPAGLVIFFKSGPFSYNGLIALYIPLGIFFVWMLGVTTQMLKAQARDERLARVETGDGAFGATRSR